MSLLIPTIVRTYTERGRTTFIDDIAIPDDDPRNTHIDRMSASLERLCRNTPGTGKVQVTPWFMRVLATADDPDALGRVIVTCLCDRQLPGDTLVKTIVHHMDANGCIFKADPLVEQIATQLKSVPVWAESCNALRH